MEERLVAGFHTSPQQRYAWRTRFRHPEAACVQLIAGIDKPFAVDRLAAAVNAVVNRHEILRTTVCEISQFAGPVQHIEAAGVGLAQVHELRGALDNASVLSRIAAEERTLVGDGPVRFVLVRPYRAAAALLVTAPTTVLDRPSLRRALAEVSRVCAGQPLAPVGVQYADYAAWHNDLLSEEDRAPRRALWDPPLAPQPWIRATELLGTTPTGPSQLDQRIRLRMLDAGTADGLLTLARDAGTDIRTALAAAWGVLCWRLAGEREVGYAVMVSGRSFAELDGALGPFARAVPTVAAFASAESFRDALNQIDTALTSAEDQLDDLDSERMISTGTALGFEYLSDRSSLGEDSDADCPIVPFTVLAERSGGSAAMVLRAERLPTGLRIAIDSDGGLVSGERADEILDRYVAVLRSAVGAPSAPLDGLALLRPGERDRLVAASSGPCPAETAGSLHERFAQQVRRMPAAVAVEHGAEQLTYRELDELANRLARRLIEAGVRPGDRVPLRLPRSPACLVSMLGILRSGAAFVPVDIRQPWSRVAFMMADLAAAVLITDDSAVPTDLPVLVLRVGWADGNGSAYLSGSPAIAVGARHQEDLAYIMYTSGSTGTPNGVGVTHRGLLNYLDWAAQAYDLGAGTGAIVHSSIGFDLTLTGLLGPLLVGQRVVLVPEAEGLGGLVTALRMAHDRTLLKLTPTHLDALTQLMAPDELVAGIRTLVLGGEALRAETIESLRAARPDLMIVNEYGPTEAVVGCVAYQVDANTPSTGAVPIGRPIAGTACYVCDSSGGLVPDGVPGELFVGGVGVAVGYLDQPDLTAARFVVDPFTPGGRLYRTGDRVHRLPSGNLVYLGRLDDQLKVRGYRIEPGEIETVLRAHPQVSVAAVTALGGQLAAQIVAAVGLPAPSADELDRYCRQRFPDYLVPAAFIVVDAVPTTSNGKLDRAALRTPSGEEMGLGVVPAAYLPPRTDTEEILATVMSAVLGRDQVGIDDNYFVIGGDSIRSVMITSRARARGVDLSVADLHGHPTIRRLSEALTARDTRVAEPRTVPFALVPGQDRAAMPDDVEDAFPLTLLQEGMIFHRAFAAKSAVYHAIASVRLRAPFDLEVLRQVIHQLLRRHPMLRTSFDLITFSKPLQLVHRTFADPLSYADLRGLPPSEQQARVEDWVAREKLRGFELDEHPLIRFMAQRLDDDTFQFTYGFHHEIVDGWSEALLVTELFDHYFSVIFDEPVIIRNPASSMRDAVALEIEALGRADNYQFWSRYLENATLMRLPRLRGSLHADDGSREIVRIAVLISDELSTALKRLAATGARPLKSVLLAAHVAVMNLYNGQPDTLTYTVTNGRPEGADGSTAIGLFVNSLALRLRMEGGNWHELIARTFDSEQESLPYRRLPMAELKRHQGNEPLAETLFFFTDYHVFRTLDRWRRRGVEHVASELYGESTFPFCAIFRLDRETSRLHVRIEYDSLQFSVELMSRIGDTYRRVLETMVVDPDADYHTRSLLSDAEYAKVVDEWNDTGGALAGDGPGIHDVIAARCRETPDAIAVAAGDAALSYAELDRRARALARALRRWGTGPESVVGVLADPGLDGMIVLLGILRAGGAYLPLDPTWPAQRLAAILRDAAPVMVLAQPEYVASVTDLSVTCPVVTVSSDLSIPSPAALAAATALPPAITADNAAYLIYTSGSAGSPKGVVVTHAALVNSTLARPLWYQQRPERFLLVSPLSFDSSVAGLYWPLCCGGTLVMAPAGSQLEPRALAGYIAEHRPTHMLGVPSLLAALLDAAGQGPLDSLRVIIAAGEASSWKLHDQVRRAVPAACLANEYGPTENTVWSTAWRETVGSDSGAPELQPQLPIGRPINGVQAYVLNTHALPVPVGVAGELYLGGAGLARGYLARPSLTARSFLPNPYTIAAGLRMYRTGDLVRHTITGELEFLGRTDHQVKIRGFRVELSEIEAVLDTHPGVSRSVVVREDRAGEGVLVAYVVGRFDTVPTGPELQQHIRQRLPKYMTPATVVVLDALPLTSTGKVDRASLPAPNWQNGAGTTPARTGTEKVLAAIWSQALNVDVRGRDANFFDMGGESLRAMHVITRTNKIFGLGLSVRSLFDAPTVAGFADTVERALAASSADALSAPVL